MRKKFFYFLALLFFWPQISLAVCPICSAAIAGGVSLSRYLGVDDTITGVWIGALILSLVVWSLNWLTKQKINFPLKNLIVFCFFYSATFLFLYWKNFFGMECNKFLGIDKLILGIISGTLGFGMSLKIDWFLRKKNKGQVYFPFQKLLLPLGILILLSFIFYFLTHC